MDATKNAAILAGLGQDALRWQLARHGELLSLEGVNLATTRPQRFIELLDDQGPAGASPSGAVRTVLAESARDFHSAVGSLTADVERAIQRIIDGAPLLNVSHEPNTLMASGVAVQPHVLQWCVSQSSITKEPRPVILFVLIDYDDGNDPRFRAPRLPGPNGQRALTLSGAVSKRNRRTIARAVPSPSTETRRHWFATIEMVIKSVSLALPREARGEAEAVRDWTRQLVREAEEIYASFPHLAEANGALVSRLRNVLAGEDVVFVSACEAVRRLGAESLLEVDALEEDLGAGLAAHVWRVCPSCAARVRCHDATSLVAWLCSRCGSEGREPIDFAATNRGRSFQLPAFVPRVSLCNQFDFSVYQFAGSSTYAGGAGHAIRSRLQQNLRGRALPPLLAWEPTHMHTTSDATANAVAAAVGDEVLGEFQRGRFAQLACFALQASADSHTVGPHFASSDGRMQ